MLIAEITPGELGWKPLGNRIWVRPDGSTYQFPPQQREVLLQWKPLPQKVIEHLALLAGKDTP